MMSATLGFFLMLVACNTECSGYPTGPPSLACVSMTPSHESVQPQTTAAPYTVSLSSACYEPGITYQVSLTSSGVAQFNGFLVEARKPDDSSDSYGTFDSNGDEYVQAINCFHGTANAAGHKNSVNWTSKSFKWTAPAVSVGDLDFVATVVQSYRVFWTGVTTRVPPCS